MARRGMGRVVGMCSFGLSCIRTHSWVAFLDFDNCALKDVLWEDTVLVRRRYKSDSSHAVHTFDSCTPPILGLNWLSFRYLIWLGRKEIYPIEKSHATIWGVVLVRLGGTIHGPYWFTRILRGRLQNLSMSKIPALRHLA
jgi:hypothetical protein